MEGRVRMKIISIISLKGGVAKTISSANIAHILSTVHNKRVLIVDNDKQGNTTKMFGAHSYEDKSVSELLTVRGIDLHEIIKHTKYKNLDIIQANMTLLKANLEVMLDTTRPQQTRFKKALETIQGEYDYCIIDNAPDINISTINALVASDDVLIPIKIDKFAFDGLEELKEQIDNTREDLNNKLCFKGCFITCYQNNEVNNQGIEWLKQHREYPLFNTHIRRTTKVDESTFASMPILTYSKRCGASKDYIKFVEEYLDK